MQKKISNALCIAGSTLSLLFFYVNCSGGFDPNSGKSLTSLASVGDTDTTTFSGKVIYEKNCAACHGPIEQTKKPNRTVEQITSAISTVPQMKFLSFLSAEEILALSAALKPTAAAEPPVVAACKGDEPITGNVVSHRLNRAELSLTFRDLFGFSDAVSTSTLPVDASGEYFDNDATSLYVNADFTAKYLKLLDTVLLKYFTEKSSSIFICPETTDTCAKSIIANFANRAFRRPATDDEKTRLLAVHKVALAQSATFADAIKASFKAALLSPMFLFRQIIHTAPNDPSQIVPLSHYELASRLSYFIWGSMPDKTLLDLAAAKKLTDDSILKQQVTRMMADKKSAPLVDRFARQWLEVGNFDKSNPDTTIYPLFSELIKADMKTETKMLLQDIFQQNLSLQTLLTANYTYLNARLANFYGIKNVTSTSFVKTPLSESRRVGVLGHGSILTMTSGTSKTSIVHRGLWVLSNLLCDVPPPPPDNVVTDVEGSDQDISDSRLSNPTCYACHSQMDPIGVGFQSFNAVGQFRQVDEFGKPVDPQGRLPDGTQFNGLLELSTILQKDNRFGFCAAKKMMIYALGRSLKPAEDCRATEIGNKSVSATMPVSQLVLNIVLSETFRKQSGAEQ